MKLRVAHLESGKCPKKYKEIRRHGRKNCILKPSYRMGTKGKSKKASLGSRKGKKVSLGSKKRRTK